MSDLQDRRSMPDTTGANLAPFVIGCTYEDRDWAEWIASHLEGLGYHYEFAEPLLPPGPAALTQVADWRDGGADLIVIASDALLHGVPEHLQLGRRADRTTPLIIVLIEDVDLPRDWDDAIRAPMFEAPDDYHASRDMLLRALEAARPHPFTMDQSADAVAATAAARREPLPAPLVVVDPFPAPEPVVQLDEPVFVANGSPREAGLLDVPPAPEPVKPAALTVPAPEGLGGPPHVIDLSVDAPAMLAPAPANPSAPGSAGLLGVPPAPAADPVPVSPWGTAPGAPAAWASPGDTGFGPPAPPSTPPPGATPWAPAAEEPAPEQPAAEQPATEQPTAETPAAEQPAERTAADGTAAELPMLDTPAAAEAALLPLPSEPALAPAADAEVPDVLDAVPAPLVPPPPAAWSPPVTPATPAGEALPLAGGLLPLEAAAPLVGAPPPAAEEARPQVEDVPAASDEASSVVAEAVIAEPATSAPATADTEPATTEPATTETATTEAAATEPAIAGVAAAPEGPQGRTGDAGEDDLPSPTARPRSGLLGGAGAAWSGARRGGASVTETEQPADGEPVPPAEPPSWGLLGAGGAAEPAEPTDRGTAAEPDDATRVDAGEASAGADAPSTPAEAAEPTPAAIEQADAEQAEAEQAEAEQADAEVEASAAAAEGEDAGARAEPVAEPVAAGARIVRLPFDAVDTLWSIEGAVELLAKGLRHRVAEPTPSAAGPFGLRAPLDAPGGVVVALTGPAGVGKTTIALTHAHRRRSDVDVVWWLRGGSPELLRADLRALAVAVGVDGTDPATLIGELRTWLATTSERWLLIIDDLASDVALDGLLPDQGRGHVVLTARHAPEGYDAVTISSPSPAAARRALFEHLTSADRQLEPLDGEALDRLAAALAEHPWAIAVAAAQLGARGISPGRLSAQLSRPPQVEALPGVTADNPLDAVLLVALEGIAETSPVAAEALVAITALAETALLRVDLDRLGGPRADVSALGGTHHFLQLGAEHAAPVGAVGEALRRLVDDATARKAARAAVRAVDSALPHVASATITDLYAPHAATAVAVAARLGVTDPAAARLERAVADWARRLHDTVPAAPTPQAQPPAPPAPPAAAPTSGERNGRHDHGGDTSIPAPPPPPAPPLVATGSIPPPDTATASVPELVELRDRSVAAAERGAYTDAIRLLEELVQRSEAAYGVDDLRTLSARNDLANALIAAGSQHRAHQLLVRVLDDTLGVYGADHPATLLAKHNLANSHADLGRHDAALTLREQVLGAREQTLGVEHPQTVSARSNLANSLAALGRVEEALSLRELVADVRLRTLGLESPQTMGALNNLANSYADAGRHEDALRLRQQVLDGRERLLGADHPHTITARNNLANSLAATGRMDAARAARERTLADCERVLGPDHPHTITARANLAFSAPSVPGAANGSAVPPAGALVSTGAAAHGTVPAPQGGVGTLQPVEVDVEVPAAPVAYGPGSGPAAPAAAEPTKKKRRFWFFGRR